MEVKKYGALVQMSEETIAEATADARAIDRWMNATPEERAEWQRQARAQRASQRAVAPVVPLSLEEVLDKLGWTPEFARHFVQPYCACDDSRDGWDYCAHARDLGLTP